nr:TetR/AcrR family transcriptional regulator [Vallitaleaceae bacterium]
MNDTFMNIPIEKQKRNTKAAFFEYANYGYENASTNRLTATLGISKGSLFKYFSNKLDLYTYLVKQSSEHLMTYLDQKNMKAPSLKESLLLYASNEYD